MLHAHAHARARGLALATIDRAPKMPATSDHTHASRPTSLPLRTCPVVTWQVWFHDVPAASPAPLTVAATDTSDDAHTALPPEELTLAAPAEGGAAA